MFCCTMLNIISQCACSFLPQEIKVDLRQDFRLFCVVWVQGVVLRLLCGWWSTGEAEEFRNHDLHWDRVQLLAFPHQLPACWVSPWHPQDWSVTVLFCFPLYHLKVPCFFVCFYFRVKKIWTCWIYRNNVFANWEKYKVSWNFYLAFIIDLWPYYLSLWHPRDKTVLGVLCFLMSYDPTIYFCDILRMGQLLVFSAFCCLHL